MRDTRRTRVVLSVLLLLSLTLVVANLRGALRGVVDLAMLLGAAPLRTEQTLAEASLLTLGD